MISVEENLTLERICSISGIFSSFGSFMVLLTFFLFPSMVKGKHFMEIIRIISMCDLISSSFFALGFPEGLLCSFQGAITEFFFVASWIFTSFLSYNLYYLVYYNKLRFSVLKINIFVWSICLIKFALPFSTGNSYGLDDENEGNSTCGIKNNNHFDTGNLWIFVSLFLPLLTTVGIMSYCAIKIYSRHQSNFKDYPVIKKAVTLISLYPIVIVLSWIPIIIFVVLAATGADVTTDFFHFGLIISFSVGGLYGFFLCIIFFSKSKEARQRWKKLIYNDYKVDRNSAKFDLTSVDDIEDDFACDEYNENDWGNEDDETKENMKKSLESSIAANPMTIKNIDMSEVNDFSFSNL